MKKIWGLIGLVLLMSLSSAYADNFVNRAFIAPKHVSKSKYDLVYYLTKNIDNDYDKLKVIAYWIASHIAYDGYIYSHDSGFDAKARKYHYDVFEKRTGICEDFAQLFQDMANIAHISRVTIVSGYVLENVHNIKRYYKRKDMPQTGHAWNKVELSDGRRFFVDTTFMARSNIRDNQTKRSTTLRHKMDLQKRGRTNDVNKNVDDFYFDFTPKSEVKEKATLHLQSKYIR